MDTWLSRVFVFDEDGVPVVSLDIEGEMMPAVNGLVFTFLPPGREETRGNIQFQEQKSNCV